MKWILALALVACAATRDPCEDVTCATGSACDAATGRCEPGAPALPGLDDLDLGAATRAFATEPDGLALVSHDREVGRLLALRLAAGDEVREARVIVQAGAGAGFDAALDGTGRLWVLAADDTAARLILSQPFAPAEPAVEVPLGTSVRLRGAPSLAAHEGPVDAAFADEGGRLYTLRFPADGSAPAPEAVEVPGTPADAALAEPVLRTFAGNRAYLFFLDEATRAVRVAGRETGAWKAETLLTDVRSGPGPSFAADLLPDGRLAVVGVDAGGRLALVVRAANGTTRTVVDPGTGDDALRDRVGAWPALTTDPQNRVTLGAYDVTTLTYRAWRLDAAGQPQAVGAVSQALLAPTLVAGPTGARVVAGVPEARQGLWVRRLVVLELE